MTLYVVKIRELCIRHYSELHWRDQSLSVFLTTLNWTVLSQQERKSLFESRWGRDENNNVERDLKLCPRSVLHGSQLMGKVRGPVLQQDTWLQVQGIGGCTWDEDSRPPPSEALEIYQYFIIFGQIVGNTICCFKLGIAVKPLPLFFTWITYFPLYPSPALLPCQFHFKYVV